MSMYDGLPELRWPEDIRTGQQWPIANDCMEYKLWVSPSSACSVSEYDPPHGGTAFSVPYGVSRADLADLMDAIDELTGDFDEDEDDADAWIKGHTAAIRDLIAAVEACPVLDLIEFINRRDRFTVLSTVETPRPDDDDIVQAIINQIEAEAPGHAYCLHGLASLVESDATAVQWPSAITGYDLRVWLDSSIEARDDPDELVEEYAKQLDSERTLYSSDELDSLIREMHAEKCGAEAEASE